MSKIIIIFCFMVSLSLNIANAAERSDQELTGARSVISTNLNDAVKMLKNTFKPLQDGLSDADLKSEDLKTKAEKLLLEELSSEEETNYRTYNYGKEDMPKLACDYLTENLAWRGGKWSCEKAIVKTDCEPALDEYRVEDANGNANCQKYQQDTPISYYYIFRSYDTGFCVSGAEGYKKLYDCVYKNKVGQEVIVNNSNCANVAKQTVAKKTCVANWSTSGWSEVNNCYSSTGAGTKIRTVSCPVGYTCTGDKPESTAYCCYGKGSLRLNDIGVPYCYCSSSANERGEC